MNFTTTSCPTGVVGYGHFGNEVIVDNLLSHFPLKVFDHDERKQRKLQSLGLFATLDEVVLQHNLILAVPPVPRKGFDELLDRIASIKRSGLVIDVCSNKLLPLRSMEAKLPSEIEILGTHPLFGQVTAADGLEGLAIAVCKTRISDSTWEKALGVLQQFWLKIKHTEPEAHDRAMAKVQGLSHFIGRVMEKCGLRRSPYATRPYRQLYGVKEIVCADSWPLFLTTQLGNPFAAAVRQLFIERALETFEWLKVERKQLGQLTSPRDVSPTAGLSFFIGYVLGQCDLEGSQYSTRTFEHLLNVKRIMDGATRKRFIVTQLHTAIEEIEDLFLRKAIRLDEHLKKMERIEIGIRAA